MDAHTRSHLQTHTNCFSSLSWLFCRFSWWVTQQDAQYVRLAKCAPPLWCVKREDQAKLRKAGQPVKFSHQPPDLHVIQRDAHARVCVYLCRTLYRLRTEDHAPGAAGVLPYLEALCAGLEQMAAPYMAVKRNEMDPAVWLRQRTRGRVYANAAKDLRKLLADYAARGGEPTGSDKWAPHYWYDWTPPLAFNRLGETLDRQEPTP